MTKRTSSFREIKPLESTFLDWSFAEFADILPDAVIILDEAMRILYLNSAAVTLFGYPTNEALGQNLEIFIPEQFMGNHQGKLQEMLSSESGSCQIGENRIVYGKHRSGNLIPLEIPVARRKYKNQSYVICMPRDNRNQLAYQQALNESQQRYRGIIDSQNTLVVRVDRENRLVFVNQAYCAMFGKSLDELIEKSFAPLVHPDDLPQTLEAMKGLEVPPYRIAVEQRVMTANGWRWISWEDSIIQDDAKNLYEIQGIGVDITEQKNIEAELSNKNSLLSGLLNSIPDITFFKDTEGVYLGGNPEFARVIGKPLDEIVNKTDFDFFDREMAEVFRENDRKMMEQKQQRHNEEWIKYPDGKEILLDTLKAPFQDIHGKTIGILGISRDITARKKAEEIAIIERNLAIVLAQKSAAADALPLVLDLALHVADMDCGGIYLVEQKSRDLVLMTHKGLSEAFVSRASRFPTGSGQYNVVMKGEPIYQPYLHLPTSKNQIAMNEGLHISAIIPVKFNDNVIACMNVASHTLDDMPEYRRNALENFAFQIGNMIARFQAQDELRESQNELRSMFDSLQDYVFVLDGNGSIIEVNQKVLDSLGYSKKELLEVSVLEVHPAEQRAYAWKIVQDMLDGLLDTCHLDLLRKDGSYIPVETKVVHGRWGNQDVLIGVSRDITERKAAEEARLKQTRLLEYRQKFEETLTSISTRFINLPSSEIDQEIDNLLRRVGELEQVNRSYVFQFDHDTASMSNTHEWCAAGIEPQIKKMQALSTGLFPWLMSKLEKLEEVYIPLVSQLPAEAQAERTHLEAQSVQSVLVVPLVSRNTLVGFFGFDAVTKQRVWSPDNILLIKMAGDILSNALTHIKMQNDLLQSEARNTALLSAVPDMILRIHRDGTVTDYKPSSANELPASLQIVGSSISHIVPDHLMKEAMNHINQVLQTKENKTMEFSLDLGDSSHVFEARFKDSGADEVTAIIRDVSDRARLEQMKSDFINRATHELRTPIATMILMIDLLDGDATDEERLEYWKILKSELGRERTLVEDLLSAGRLESDQAQWHFQFIDSEKIVRQAMSQFEVPAREKEIKLSLQTMGALDGNSFVVFADENALTQVFVNLVGNAIKFTPVGGRVSILLKRINGGIEISVVDTGIGILSEDIPMLFNRFFRGTNAIQEEIQGTGIGLFIVRSIMEKHRGTIKVHSKVGKGSQFVIWMPVDHQ